MIFLVEEATIHFRKAFPNFCRVNDEQFLVAFARMSKIFIKQRGITHDVRVFKYSEEEINNKKTVYVQ